MVSSWSWLLIISFQMNRRLSFYGFPGSGISSDWAPSRFANRFQLKKKVNQIWTECLCQIESCCICQFWKDKLQSSFILNIGHVCKASILCWNGTWMFISITFLRSDEAWLLRRNNLWKDQRKFHMCFWGWLVSFINLILSVGVIR